MSEITPVLEPHNVQHERWLPPPPLKPGPEMEALKPFQFDCVWTGTVEAGGMGPDSPVMEANGRGTFTPILDGVWLAGDFEQDQFLHGEKVITWKAHYVVGWDPRAQVYKITYVDSNGSASLMQGRIEGNRFIVQTPDSDPVQLRLTWERMEQGRVKWLNECSINDNPWFLIEQYICTPA